MIYDMSERLWMLRQFQKWIRSRILHDFSGGFNHGFNILTELRLQIIRYVGIHANFTED